MTEKGIMFQCDEELKKEIDILAKREGKKLKELMAEIITDYVKIHKEGNPQHLISSWQEDVDFEGFAAMAVKLDKKKEWLNSKKRTKKDLESLFWHVQEWGSQLKKKGFEFGIH